MRGRTPPECVGCGEPDDADGVRRTADVGDGDEVLHIAHPGEGEKDGEGDEDGEEGGEIGGEVLRQIVVDDDDPADATRH